MSLSSSYEVKDDAIAKTEVNLYLIKFSVIKYRLVPVYSQEDLKPDFKNSKVQLIIPNLLTLTNLWDFPTMSQCQTV